MEKKELLSKYYFLIQEGGQNNDGTQIKTEYRVWNAFRSKLGACILNGVNNIYMKPGAKVLYLGAANGTTVSHVSDLVGPVYIFYNYLVWNSICC